eukprot:TRINITY_DN75703_c0_g1_i1.p1 TRINITY_DN75703_c0_g1~~TRINITY_DN75703_c0_g1_i1.p1  ORF type:complete len:497 (+),score=28.61 TRINITY_DN75703_c0_g1_i1:139-1491(+)
MWNVGYHGLSTQTPKEEYCYTDFPPPSSFEEFPTRTQMVSYFNDYAAHFRLNDHIRLRTRVVSATPKDSLWVVKTCSVDDESNEDTWTFDFVVVASGTFGKPRIPTFSKQEIFRGKILHSSDVQSLDQFRGKSVVLVGFGKSGTELATHISEVARSTALVFRAPYYLLTKNVGPFNHKNVIYTRLFEAIVPLKAAPYYYKSNWMIRLFQLLMAPIIWLFFKIMQVGVTNDTFKNNKDLTPNYPVVKHLARICLGSGMTPDQFYPRVHAGKIKAIHSNVDHYLPDGVTLENGTNLQADYIIMATGFVGEAAQVFPDEIHEAFFGGPPSAQSALWRNTLHPKWRNVAIIGHTGGLSNICCSEMQSIWLAGLLANIVKLPDETTMYNQMEERKRRVWPMCIFPRNIQFYDTLVEDLGCKTLRKKGFFANYLKPYKPADYQGLYEEALANKRGL